MLVRYSLVMLALAGCTLLQAAPADLKPAPSSAELEKMWQGFIAIDDEGTRAAHQHMKRMIAAPEATVAFLADRLQPVKPADAKLIQKLIADLDSSDFKTREDANQKLAAMGVLALDALKTKLAKDPGSLEAKKRMSRLVTQAEQTGVSAEELRAVRGIFVLGELGTPAARQVLDKLAKGASGVLITDRARKTLAQIDKK